MRPERCRSPNCDLLEGRGDGVTENAVLLSTVMQRRTGVQSIIARLWFTVRLSFRKSDPEAFSKGLDRDGPTA